MEDEYEFLATVLEDDAEVTSHYVRVPDDVARALVARGVTKLEGRLDLTVFRRTLHRHTGGGHVLKFGKSWLRGAEVRAGDEVVIAMSEDPNPERVDVPVELEEALEWEPEARAVWDAMNPGKRRTLAYQVERGKKKDTRRRSAQKLLAQLQAEVEARDA